jgi:hypothetical protein
VIVFGIWVQSEERLAAFALSGLQAHGESDSAVLQSRTDGCIFEAYNEILDAAAQMHGLEALVLLRDDVLVRDGGLCAKVRAATDDADVVGLAGARHVSSLRWWEGEEPIEPGHGLRAAHVIDGAFMALSPPAVRALRFDRRIWTGMHGYDAELSFLARASGLRVGVMGLDAVRHAPARPDQDVSFLQADLVWRHRWSHIPDA